MHKAGSVLNIETYKIIWDLVTHTDQLIPARGPKFEIIKKKKFKKEKEKKGKLPNHEHSRLSGQQSGNQRNLNF